MTRYPVIVIKLAAALCGTPAACARVTQMVITAT
jgi:hypothetical protein